MPDRFISWRAVTRVVLSMFLVLITAVGGAAMAQAQTPPEPQGEFRPLSELPQRDQLPAAPLLVAAYAFVALALFAYVWSVSSRLGAVKRDIARLEAELKRSDRRV